MTRPARPIAVALVSAGTLAFEILLVRLFAIEQFHHFAYMAIGVAMLGFGAAGTLLALVELDRSSAERWFVVSTFATGVALLASPAVVDRIAVDAAQIAWDGTQWVRLGAVYAVLALPFGFGALAVLLAITLDAAQPGRTYGASFVGSGCGAIAALATLWWLSPSRALAVPAVFTTVAAMAVTRPLRARALAVIALAAALTAVARPPWTLDVSPYKGLLQAEALPGATRVVERSSPLGWVVAVEAASWRHAPGLSLAYRDTLPRQTGLFVDGQVVGAIPHTTDATNLRFLAWLPAAAPYALGAAQRVLIVGAGDGLEVRTARASGARAIVAVELNPDLAAINRAPGDLDDRVQWMIGDARHVLSGLSDRFDVVSIGPGGGFGTATAGVHSLNEDFLHTVDAYEAFLGRLTETGVFAVTRWLSLPPRASVRAALTAAAALRRVAPASAERGLIVLRSWGTATVLVKPRGFTAADVARLRAWATARRLDVDWHPGLDAPNPRFNLVDDPVLYRAAAAAATGEEAARRFTDTYEFAVAPVGDHRPYPHHFLRLSAVPQFFGSARDRALPFAEWGYLALIGTLLQATVAATALLLVPLVRRRTRTARPRPAMLGYFAAIGFAYLAAEIAAIQQLSLLLGHPVYAVAAVFAAILIASGLGAWRSDAVAARRAGAALAGLAATLGVYAAGLLALVHWAQTLPLALRALLALAALAPPAFLMGFPFPTGLRLLASASRPAVAWAWAINGFAAVIAAPLSALIAIEWGSPALFASSAFAYLGAAAVARGAVAPTLSRDPR